MENFILVYITVQLVRILKKILIPHIMLLSIVSFQVLQKKKQVNLIVIH